MVRTPSIGLPFYPDCPDALADVELAPVLQRFAPDEIHLAAPLLLGRRAGRIAVDLGVPVLASYHTDVAGFTRRYHLSIAEETVWSMVRTRLTFGRTDVGPIHGDGVAAVRTRDRSGSVVATRRRLGHAGRAAVVGRTWPAVLDQVVVHYRRLAEPAGGGRREEAVHADRPGGQLRPSVLGWGASHDRSARDPVRGCRPRRNVDPSGSARAIAERYPWQAVADSMLDIHAAHHRTDVT